MIKAAPCGLNYAREKGGSEISEIDAPRVRAIARADPIAELPFGGLLPRTREHLLSCTETNFHKAN